MRAIRNRWIILALALAASCMTGSARAARLTFVGQAIAIVGPLSPGDATRFARMADLQGPGRVAFVYLASDGGDLSAATLIARRIHAAGMTTVVDARRFPCVDACVAIFVAGARRLYLHAPGSGGPVAAAGFRGLGFSDRGDAGGDLAAAMTEFGAAPSVALLERAVKGQIYRVSGEDARASGAATALAPD